MARTLRLGKSREIIRVLAMIVINSFFADERGWVLHRRLSFWTYVGDMPLLSTSLGCFFKISTCSGKLKLLFY